VALPPSVLLVDDDPSILKAIGRLLRTRGHDVTMASSTVDAITKAYAGSHDVALLDIDLDRQDAGVQLGAMLVRSGRIVRVVFHSACQDADILRRATDVGPVHEKGTTLPDIWW
jgi:two-component system, OmpR family, KDP operon response regulator KdpE